MAAKDSSSLTSLLNQAYKTWKTGLPKLTEFQAVALTSCIVVGMVLGVRHLGKLEPLELAAFNQLVRMRPDAGIDPRLLIVEVTEADIRTQKRYPLTDQVLAETLAKLQKHQPRAIGIDIVRDIPNEPGYQQLVAQLQKPNVIAIRYLGNLPEESTQPPPSISPKQVGFNDVLTDPDNVVRRNLILDNDNATTYYSFATLLALTYLAERCPQSLTQPRPAAECLPILPRMTGSGELQFGKVTLKKLKPNSGGYRTVEIAGYQILLNYRSPENVARRVTLTEVLTDKVNPNLVKDKVVLIGITAPSIKDVFSTPFSATLEGDRQMPGIVLHAQMVSHILSVVLDGQPPFWFWADWVEDLWVVGWVMLSGVLSWRLRNTLLLGLANVAMLGLLFSACFWLFMGQGWVPMAAPALGFVLTAGLVVAYRAQQAQQQQQMVMKLLGQNTSPEIATALWEGRDRLLDSGHLPGQIVTATILFTDIRHFSTTSEQMPPEMVMSWLNEYLSAMTQEVQLHQGITNKFTGDGLLAVFGVPVARLKSEDIAEDARLAVSCALGMSDRILKLNHDWQQRGLPTIETRVGIYTGPVMVGSLGGKERLEYGVIGDSVNSAARLESCAKDKQVNHCRILIAGQTWNYVKDHFEVEHWGLLPLKGKQYMVDVYRVIRQLMPNSAEASHQSPKYSDGQST